jgi:hypothetical protein
VGALHVGPEHTVVDFGYGHGGPSLWVAQLIGAKPYRHPPRRRRRSIGAGPVRELHGSTAPVEAKYWVNPQSLCWLATPARE